MVDVGVSFSSSYVTNRQNNTVTFSRAAEGEWVMLLCIVDWTPSLHHFFFLTVYSNNSSLTCFLSSVAPFPLLPLRPLFSSVTWEEDGHKRNKYSNFTGAEIVLNATLTQTHETLEMLSILTI